MKYKVLLALIFASFTNIANAANNTEFKINIVDEKGVSVNIGTISATDSKFGLVLTPSLHGLLPGLHGFHVHQNPSCEANDKDGKSGAALAAGGHLDPAKSNKHSEPWGDGHLGDLPPLYVDADGNASQPVLAPRLKVADLAGHSIMIHAGGDNHADHPEPLGGGGARVACGVIK